MKAAIAAAPVAEIDLGVSSLLPSDGVVPPCPADLRAARSEAKPYLIYTSDKTPARSRAGRPETDR